MQEGVQHEPQSPIVAGFDCFTYVANRARRLLSSPRQRARASLLFIFVFLVVFYLVVLLQADNGVYLFLGLIVLSCVLMSILISLYVIARNRLRHQAYQQVPQHVQQIYLAQQQAAAELFGVNLAHLQLAMTDRDFDANDYEDLLRLDEGLDAGNGLESSQIARYPTYTIPSSYKPDSKKPMNCTICLDNVAAGDEMRTMPCMHHFHSKCIDKWLKAKPNCPVCLHSVLQSQGDRKEDGSGVGDEIV